MSIRARQSLVAGVIALAAGLLAATPALADRISYSVAPGAGYTVTAEGGGNGIVKVTYTTCPAAGAATSFPLTVSTPGSGTASAVILKDEGDGTMTVTPATVTFKGNSATVKVTIVPQTPGPNGPAFRLKFKGTPGLGEGPGVMVKINCVAAPPVTPKTPTPAPKTPAPKTPTPDSPAPTTTVITVPTTTPQPAFGVLSFKTSRCVALPRSFRVHLGESATLSITVRQAGSRVAGALVRVFVPGRHVVVHRTNSQGVAVFRVRPGHRGTVIVQSNRCAGTARVHVLPARITVKRGDTPKFTG
jgi:hypothetical protein